MSDALEPVIQECTTCGTQIDVSDEEPLGLMHCPTCGAAMRVRRLFGNFEPVEVLGAGGMGAVYRAHDHALNRSVALKLLRREYTEHPEFIQQFEHEAAITALVNHPNVVKVYSTGSDHGLFFIAMELVDKGSLDDLIMLQGRVAELQCLEVGIQAAQGLRAAFQRGLMHRDVKPGNILFADAHHAKIVDFGLAAPLGAGSVTGAGEVWGTPYYVAPEKLESPPYEDFRSDIYSLGATLFHALAGRAPYEAEDASMVALKHLKSQPVSLQAFAPDVSASTAYVINRTLHKDPKQRYASYDEVIQHLEYARNQLINPTGKGNLGQQAKMKPRVKQRVVMESRGQQTAMSFITLLMFAALGTGGYFLYQHRDRFFTPKPPPKVDNSKALQAAAEYKGRYTAARRQLASGQAEEAAKVFHALEAEKPSGEQPQLDWITLQAGLATVVNGKLDEAKADFEKLAARGPWSPDPFDTKLADFMTKISKLMVAEDAPTADSIQTYNKDNYEAIALLLLGVKAWEQGEFEAALTILRQFESSHPVAPDDWIYDYRPVATGYIEQYEKFKGFSDKLSNVGEPVKAKVELPKLKEELATLGFKGALAKKAQAAFRKAQQAVDDFEEEQHKAVAEMEESDAQALAVIKEKADPLAKNFQFKEAVTVAKAAQAITEGGKKKRQTLIDRYDWLAGFKSTLTSDLNAHAYPGGVIRTEGLPVAGTVHDADDKGLIVKVGVSEVNVPWLKATYEGIIAIGRSFLRSDLPPDRLGDRLWYLGVYSEFAGKKKEAGTYFAEAVKRKPSYEEDWKTAFPEVPKPEAAP